MQPLAQPAGHAGKRRHAFVPVSNADDGRDVRFRRAVLQILGQEWRAGCAGGSRAPVSLSNFRCAERAAVVNFLPVMPRAHHQKHFVVARVFRLDRFVDGHRAVDVFLIPQAVHQHDRNFQRLRGENLVHGLLAPEGVVARMLENLAPEAHLFEAVAAAEFARGARLHVHVVIVEVARSTISRSLSRVAVLLVDVGHVLLAKRAVVKPVVAHPAIDHGVHRHGNFQRGMRIDERHQRQKAVVGNAEDADFAVGFGNVFHQPVDGVVGVGGVIDRRGIQRAAQRAVHHVVAFGAVLAANILHDADVAAFHDHVGGVVVALRESGRGASCCAWLVSSVAL